MLAMSTGLLKRYNTESHATKRKHCVCLGILPMGPTCPHRIVWFLLPKSVCLRYKPCVLLGPSAERSIIVLSNRWLHWGLFVDDVQTCNYTYMCKYEPAHRKNVHTHRWKCVHQSYKKLHHTQWADVWKFPLQSWHQVTCTIIPGVFYGRLLRVVI